MQTGDWRAYRKHTTNLTGRQIARCTRGSILLLSMPLARIPFQASTPDPMAPPAPHSTPAAPSATGRRCPVCARGYDASARFCAWDGASLERDQIGPIGTLVAGRYRIERHLGSGGMGAVWLARDTHLPRYVALKGGHHDITPRPEDLARLRREAANAAAFDHPNLVRILDLIDWDGAPALVLEYAEGLTLAETIRLLGPLPPPIVAVCVRQLAAALMTVHRRGAVHRDLKPGNVIVGMNDDESLRLRLFDYGITRRLDDPSQSITGRGMAIGTAAYMAPEQLLGLKVGPPADVFSLAVVTCTMLLGGLPVGVPGEPFDIARVPRIADWPEGLRKALQSGLQRDPAIRVETPALFAEAIWAACSSVTDLPLSGKRFGTTNEESSGLDVPITVTVSQEMPAQSIAP